MREVLRCEELATGTGYHLKAQAARSEWEGDEAGYYLKMEAAHPTRTN
ncbi:hypothetical protein [Bacillus paranthracis]|nr:hypothetical protein [Bacillus paranthracis]